MEILDFLLQEVGGTAANSGSQVQFFQPGSHHAGGGGGRGGSGMDCWFQQVDRVDTGGGSSSGPPPGFAGWNR